jgi:hypothetical protein
MKKPIYFLTFLFVLFSNIMHSQTQNCLDFDGSDDVVTISPGPNIGNDPFTVEFWAKPDNASSGLEVLLVWDCGWGSPTRLDIRLDGSYLTIYSPSVGHLYSSFSITEDEYFHVSLTKSVSGTNLYANGDLVLSTGNISVGSGIRLGRWCSHSGFNGEIDEFRIWNYARTESEIESTMNSELSGNEPGLLTYLDFNQGIPNGNNSGVITAIDKTGNGYDATLYTFVLSGNSSNWIGSTAPVFPDDCPNDPNNDIDGDEICGDVDNCPDIANPNQEDFDNDGL